MVTSGSRVRDEDNVPEFVADNQAAMAELLDLLITNKVRLIVDQVLPLSEAAEAHTRLSNRGAMGKIILVP